MDGQNDVERWNPNAPLGAEDAARRRDVEEVFVDVRSLIQQPYLGTNDIRSIKVVVGKKGSGKTHVLRYIEKEVQSEREVIYCSLSDNTIPNYWEGQFRSLDRPFSRSKWSKFWRIVISLSILSGFLGGGSSRLRRAAVSKFLTVSGFDKDYARADEWPATQRHLVTHFADRFFPRHTGFDLSLIRENQSPTAIIHQIFNPIRAIASLDKFLDHIDIETLEREVATLARNFRPFHVIIDGVDDVSWKQPRLWLDFQVGLFDAIFFYNQATRSSDHIHITASIRNFVFLTAMESMFADRVRQLLSLNWNPKSALSFLNDRLRQVSYRHFADAGRLEAERPLASWLGFGEVRPLRREDNEPVEQYLLRHTRQSPRNIVRMFNLLAEAKNRNSEAGLPFSVTEFRQIVSGVSREIAEIMLKTAAEEIIALVPAVSDGAVGGDREMGLITWVASCLEAAITEAETETILKDRFMAMIREIADRLLDVESRTEAEQLVIFETLEAVMWRCNLFAYRSDRNHSGNWVFSWSPREDRRPKRPEIIGFHSCLIDLCELEVSEHGPVF